MAPASASVMGLKCSLQRVTPMAGSSLSAACFSSSSSSQPYLSKSQSSASSQLVSEFLTRSWSVALRGQVRRSTSAVTERKRIPMPTTSVFLPVSSNPHDEQLKEAEGELKVLFRKENCHPIMVRLGFNDIMTYDKDGGDWPNCGGANGSLRYSPELIHRGNRGLIKALYLIDPIKDKYPKVSYADLYQMCSATAIELAGGPKIKMRYGRVDTPGSINCPKEGYLPDAGPPNPAAHLRKVFYRMGCTDQEIVVLSGGHTLGRARPERSGWGKEETKYTKDGPGTPGGQSWTVEWLKFDNSYFKEILEQKDEDLLVLPTDAILAKDPKFREYVEKYAADQDLFFADYSAAHTKMSEVGAKFDPPEGIFIEDVVVKVPTPDKVPPLKIRSS